METSHFISSYHLKLNILSFSLKVRNAIYSARSKSSVSICFSLGEPVYLLIQKPVNNNNKKIKSVTHLMGDRRDQCDGMGQTNSKIIITVYLKLNLIYQPVFLFA